MAPVKKQKPKSKREPDDKSQSERFVNTARQLGLDETRPLGEIIQKIAKLKKKAQRRS